MNDSKLEALLHRISMQIGDLQGDLHAVDERLRERIDGKVKLVYDRIAEMRADVLRLEDIVSKGFESVGSRLREIETVLLDTREAAERAEDAAARRPNPPARKKP